MKSEILSKELIKKDLILTNLLSNAELVGGIFNMGFDDCLIITNDIWKKNAGGIPQHCFLLATVMKPNEAPKDEDDEEIILLRVIGPASLPAETELINVRSDAMRELITESGRAAAREPSKIIDVLTLNEIQFSGIKAKILGTFYEEVVNDSRILRFGSDIDNFYSSSRYKVYKPYGESLSIIVSYPEITKEEELKRQEKSLKPSRVRIGAVRYGSTDRRVKKIGGKKTTTVPVKISIEDFISMKTAIFGMTRLGKSNTMKIIATSVFQYAIENKIKIGQLLFDPTGEYANINQQDNTALAQIGNDFVTIFKYGADKKKENEKPLNLNFYEESLIEVIWDMIQNHVSLEAQSHYLKNFAEVDVIGPKRIEDGRSDFNRAARRRSALYAILIKAGFKAPKDFKINIVANKALLEIVNEEFDDENKFKTWGNGMLTLNSFNIISWWDRIVELQEQTKSNLNLKGKDWIDNQLNAILVLYKKPKGRIGFTILSSLRKFHSPETKKDYVEEILEELIAGKIVIVDLSFGTENVLQYCSERVIHGILNDASESFRNNKKLKNIQIFIEEAHRLFNRTKFEKPNPADPYVRLAKEAAKYKIGLIYATQEVTSVDSQILANTSNWIVTHLNNHKEVNELSKYYDFKDYYNQIIKSEDVGFARIKTKSGRYIIPTQIDLFDKKRIEQARILGERMKKVQGD